MKKLLRALGILVAVAALGAGGYWLYQTRFASTASAADAESSQFTQVVAVQRGDLAATISVVGGLYAVQQEDLHFDRASGTTQLVTLDVEAGHTVTVGQEMATIDPSPYAQALDQASSELQESEERLADLQTPPTDLEIARADLTVARSKLTVREAKQHVQDLLNPDVSDLESRIADAQEALEEAQTDLDDLESDEDTADRLSDLREKEAEVSAEYSRLATENYSDAYHQDRVRKAFNVLLDSQEAIVRAEMQAEMALLTGRIRVRRAEESLDRAEEALADAQAGADELELAQANMDIAEAEVALAEAEERRVELDAEVDAVALAVARANVDKKRLAVQEAEDDLAATTIRAPFAGTVLEIYAARGDLINSNSQIVTLADLDLLEVLAAVDETTIREVETEQDAIIAFDAFPGQQFRGQVLSVPLEGTLQGGVMVYQVPISLQGVEGLPLLVGMTANVEIQTGYVEGGLLVPAMALQNVGGFYQVLVPGRDPGAGPESVPVEVGLSDGVYTQIVRGLIEGDQVVMQLEAADSQGFGLGAMRQMMGGGGGRPPGQTVPGGQR